MSGTTNEEEQMRRRFIFMCDVLHLHARTVESFPKCWRCGR